MIKFLNEIMPSKKDISKATKVFNIKDVILCDEEMVFINRKELLDFHDEFCDIWDSKGNMRAMIEAEMTGGGGHVLLRWEDGSKDWIRTELLRYFEIAGKASV